MVHLILINTLLNVFKILVKLIISYHLCKLQL